AAAPAERDAPHPPPRGARRAHPQPPRMARPSAGPDGPAAGADALLAAARAVRRGGGLSAARDRRPGDGGRRGHPALRPGGGDAPPFALPMMIEHGGRVLSFISTIATFNTPMDVTVSELAIETFLPADPETAAALGRFSRP